MAVVYLAFDPYMERPVAIKVLLKDRSYDDSLRSRFKRESRMVASLNHPAIVPVYDFGEENEQPYLVMRYMEGGSLRERLRLGPIHLADVALLLNQIAPALDTTHSHKIIHRDLKPSNILFDGDNKAYLADFGLAKFAEGMYTTLTHNDGGMVGTPAYMSPEQIRAQAHLDGRTDIYALGVILFEMLVGDLPFSADGRLPIALMHLSDPVPVIHTLNPSLPEQISHVLIQAMAKDRDDRFNTASELTVPFIEAANLDVLSPMDSPNAPPFILQPESENGLTSTSSYAPSSDDSKEPLPTWLQSWLSSYGTKQDIGRSRTRGTLEDRFRVGWVKTEGGLPLFVAIVSDGGSSLKHGHLAAELVITELFNRIEQSKTAVPEDIPDLLHQALQQTNRTLFEVSQKNRNPLIMQSTVALVAIHENRLFIAHVGNGRIYLSRKRSLRCLTRNTRSVSSTTNNFAKKPHLGSGSSAVGQQPEVHIDLGLYLNGAEDETAARQNQGLLLKANDRLLLCSDGLITHHGNGWRRQQQRHLLRRVITECPPAEAANVLVKNALSHNVADNVTAVVLQAPGTVPHVPFYKKRPFQLATTALPIILLIIALLALSSRTPQSGVFVPPGTATQIAQIINGLTATAVTNMDQSTPPEIPPLIAPEAVPDPGFAVIFAAGEGAMFRPSGGTAWQAARAGDLVAIGENAAIQSGNGRMGVVLSDGAELYLAPEAEVALTEVNKADDQAKLTRVSLDYGRLLIHYQNADPHDFELDVPSEAKVLLPTNNNVVGVIYNQNTEILQMDCFVGSCRLRSSSNTQLLLPAGLYGVVEGVDITTNSPSRPTLYCDLAPTLVACPTPTPAPTQTLPPIVQTVIAATETAVAQTTTPTPALTPSSTSSPTPSPSVTPLPTITPQPGASDTPQPTTVVPTVTPSSTKSPTPVTPTDTPMPTNTPTPTPTDTPEPTSTLRFTASPPPTLTPTSDPNT